MDELAKLTMWLPHQGAHQESSVYCGSSADFLFYVVPFKLQPLGS